MIFQRRFDGAGPQRFANGCFCTFDHIDVRRLQKKLEVQKYTIVKMKTKIEKDRYLSARRREKRAMIQNESRFMLVRKHF